MVDLKNQYLKLKNDIDSAVVDVFSSTNFINGQEVIAFSKNLSNYLNGTHVIPCANGTDALQIAIMALDLNPGDEIIVPAFTYVATAEVIGLLGLTPVLVDVNLDTFNIDTSEIENAISEKTKAIVPVHLFGQCCNMEDIMGIAKKHNLYVIEDTAQAIGSEYTYSNGTIAKAGTIGHIGCTSFFPTKNLGCYGDGGAIFTSNPNLAEKIRMIANHGQVQKYVHKFIGVNSRLDTIQATILDIKLKYLDDYNKNRIEAANYYDLFLKSLNEVSIPVRSNFSSHVFHQYTICVSEFKRDQIKKYLDDHRIPTMIYYPIPLNEQEAFKDICRIPGSLDNTNLLCKTVLSLPMHTELSHIQQDHIINTIKNFYNSYE